MTHYVIASNLITVLDVGAPGSFFKPPTLKHYSNRELRNFFDQNRDMLVFNSLEDAECYIKEKRFILENTADERYFGYQEYPIYEIELRENTNIETYPIETKRKRDSNEDHSYRLVPGRQASRLASVKVGQEVRDVSASTKGCTIL